MIFRAQEAAVTGQKNSTAYNAGLRAYMLSVYNYMALALGITGAAALMTFSSDAMMQAIFGTPLQWVVLLAPLGVVLYLNFRIQKLSFSAAQGWFWAFAAIMGVSLSSLLVVYTGESIARAFFVTAGAFAGLSLYGYTTKKDLTAMGSFMIMGLFGVILLSIVNMFMKSSGLEFAISLASVGIFAGLMAYDTQKIKNMYFTLGEGTSDTAKKTAILGALSLYLDFINMMIAILRLVGDRR